MDATIMCRNLADLNREGIVALPIHDSVIVQAKHESKAFADYGAKFGSEIWPSTATKIRA